MDRRLTPHEVRSLADGLRVSEDPTCHLWQHGLTIADAILALRHCYRVQEDQRSHRGKTPTGRAYRADCHYFRDATMRIDFNLVHNADGDLILVVTGFIREDLA